MIECIDVHRSYLIPQVESGLKGIFRNLFSPLVKVKRAVEGISFTIKPGEAVGYVGTNGAGKSTTIKLILGILQPDRGEIRIMNQKPSPLSEKTKRRIGVVFGQRSQLWWNLPVRESLSLFAKIYQVPPDEAQGAIDDLTERLEIGRLLNQPARQLSLGEKMRCDLAIACLHKPELLILDEPTIGLDVASRFRLREFLKERNRTAGATIFLTTHDLGDIQEVCGRIILIDRGKMLADDSLPALCRRLGKEPCLQFVFTEALNSERILAMEDLISRTYSGPWSLETNGDFAASIRLPMGQPTHIERLQHSFLDQFRISTCTFSDSLPLERILRQLGTPVPAGRTSIEISDGVDVIKKARHIRRRRPSDAAVLLLELAEKASSESDRLAILLLLRGLEGGRKPNEALESDAPLQTDPCREDAFKKLHELSERWPEASLQATLVRMSALFGDKNNPQAREYVVCQLEHSDARVRANAVEAWGILGCSGEFPQIRNLEKDLSPRVRANVVLLGLNRYEAQAFNSLQDMLAQPATAESAAFAVRIFFESRPLERRLAGSNQPNEETMEFLLNLFALEDQLAESIKRGGPIRQQALALAAFPYPRGFSTLFFAAKAFGKDFPADEIKRLTGVEF